MYKRFPDIGISAIAATVPADTVEVRSIKGLFEDGEVERVIKNTGIERFRRTGKEVTAADLCVISAQTAMLESGLKAADFDGLILVTANPDYQSPPTSHLLQNRLGFSTSIPCFDLTFGCSGYIYGLLQASLLIAAGVARRVMVLVGETTTKTVDPRDKSTVPLFGDAGSATVVERDAKSSLAISVFSDGSGANQIIVPNSGARRSDDPPYLKMNGLDVFSFASRQAPQSIQEFLKEANVSIADLDGIVLHQASKMIVDFILKKIKVDPGLSCNSLQDYGNTGSASIPLSIVTDRTFARLKKRNVLLSGFGVGLSWGVVLADLSKTKICALTEIGS